MILRPERTARWLPGPGVLFGSGERRAIIAGVGCFAPRSFLLLAAQAPQYYSLPPDKLRRAIEYAHAGYTLHFASEFYAYRDSRGNRRIRTLGASFAIGPKPHPSAASSRR